MVTFLLPEEIGLAALGLLIVQFGVQFGSLGLNNAFIHKADPSPEDRRTYYSFQLLIGAGSLALVALAAPAISRFYPDYQHLSLVIWAFAGASTFTIINQSQIAFLEKDLRFNRIAALDVFSAAATTIAGPGLAYLGFGVWAVVGEFAAGVLARFALLHFRFRPYRPRLGWDRGSAGWFWRFGKTVWMNSNMIYVLDHFDDFWVSTTLGKLPFGWYSKAYEFSRYPRRVIAAPILSVFFPTFAFLQNDRPRLSRAFFRAASLIVRFGGLLALVAAIAAPEVFRLFLPDAWQPMRPVFQLMIVYTFLDPLTLSVRRLLLATGRTKDINRACWVQLAIFLPAVVLGARWGGISGVALAADLMVLVGVVMLFGSARRVVDFAQGVLWLKPALAVAGITGLAVLLSPALAGYPDPWLLAGKLILVPILYTGFLYATEREQLLTGFQMIRSLSGRQGGVRGNRDRI
jgi:O-antigen/teichoic acid export membrane protein